MSEHSNAGTPAKTVAPLLGPDVAEAEFARFGKAMELDFDTSRMSADDLTGFEDQKRIFIDALIAGHLTVDDSGRPVFKTRTLPNNVELVFNEPAGESFMSMDMKKKDHDFRKLYGVMAHMCGVHQGIFAQLLNRDLKICQAVMTLFLG